MLINWKTTLAGLATILIPVLNQIIPILPPPWAAIIGGIVAGVGLILAKDAK